MAAPKPWLCAASVAVLSSCIAPPATLQTLSVGQPTPVSAVERRPASPVARPRSPSSQHSVTSAPDARTELLRRLREHRKAGGVADVRRSASLDRAAQGLADDMARTGEFSHRAGGTTAAKRAIAEGHVGGRFWENIGVAGGATPGSLPACIERVWQGWLKSPSHAANLRMPANDVGVGVSHDAASGKWYFVLMLVEVGRPQP
jgi:uncharacterized protein YkwD